MDLSELLYSHTWPGTEPFPTTRVPDQHELRTSLGNDLINSLTVLHLALEKDRQILDTSAKLAPASLDPCMTMVRRCSELARRLLAEDPREPRNEVPTDLATTLEGLKPFLRQLLPDRLRLEMSLPATPVRVLASPAQIHHLTCNLVLNAKDAITGSGTITISLEAPQTAGGNRMARIRVSVDGRGLPAAALTRLLRPYFTGRPARRGKGSSLRNARTIIEKLGGSIEVESEAGKGTTVVLHCPAYLPEVWPC